MSERRKLILALLALLFAGCSKDRVAGGATETGNGLNIQVMNANGNALAKVQVQFVKTDTWASDVAALGAPIVITLTTDTQGWVRLDALTPGTWSKQVDQDSALALEPVSAADSNSVLQLQKTGTVRMRLDSSQAASLRVVGSTWNAQPDSLGYFHLTLPPGAYSFVSVQSDTMQMVSQVNIRVGSSLDTTLVENANRVIIDDFTSGNMHTTLSQYTGIGNWFLWAPTGTRVYSTSDSSFISFNNQLEMLYQSDSAFYQAIAGISFINQQGYHALNLSSMDSLCYDVLGDGTLTLILQKFVKPNVVNAASSPTDSLHGAWTHICYTPASFGPAWDTLKTISNTWSFMAQRGSHLQLRNIVLWGVPLQDLSP